MVQGAGSGGVGWGFRDRVSWGGKIQMAVDGFVVCDWARKRVLECLTCANEECVVFCYESVVEDGVCFLQHEAQWAGTPRVQPLYEWFSSTSTACEDARGRIVVYMYMYVQEKPMGWRGHSIIQAEGKNKKRIRDRSHTLANYIPAMRLRLHSLEEEMLFIGIQMEDQVWSPAQLSPLKDNLRQCLF